MRYVCAYVCALITGIAPSSLTSPSPSTPQKPASSGAGSGGSPPGVGGARDTLVEATVAASAAGGWLANKVACAYCAQPPSIAYVQYLYS